MSRGIKFTEAQLRERGFNTKDSRVWSRDGVQAIPQGSSPSKLEPNAHRKSKRSKTKKQDGKGSVPVGTRFVLIIHSYRTRLMDASNACFKALEDCLTKEGIIPDDGPQWCDPPIFLQTQVKRGMERTDIEVLSYNVEGKAA